MNTAPFLLATLLLAVTPALAQTDGPHSETRERNHGQTAEPHDRSDEHGRQHGERPVHPTQRHEGRHGHIDDHAEGRGDHPESCRHAEVGSHHADGSNHI